MKKRAVPTHPSPLFAALNLTRDPVTGCVDYEWPIFQSLLANSGIEPILVAQHLDKDFYVPMLITLYRHARAAGQPMDLATEAVNRDFDPSGEKERIFRNSVRRAMRFVVTTTKEQRRFVVCIPPNMHFSELALRASDAQHPHYDLDTLDRILIHSGMSPKSLLKDPIDLYSLLVAWYGHARLAGEPDDAFMESITDTVASFTLEVAGKVLQRRGRQPCDGLFFAAAIGPYGEDVPVRVPADVRFEQLGLNARRECQWAPIYRILSVSGIDIEMMSTESAASLTQPAGTARLNAPLTALLRAWSEESARVGEPVDETLSALLERVPV